MACNVCTVDIYFPQQSRLSARSCELSSLFMHYCVHLTTVSCFHPYTCFSSCLIRAVQNRFCSICTVNTAYDLTPLCVWQNKWFTENKIRIGRAISPPGSPTYDFPSSPSSELVSSPPRKRGRYSPGFSGDDFTDDEEVEEELAADV